MKKSMLRKVLLLACSAVLLVCLSVGATVAYLTSAKTVTNTFTVGKVAITMDEAKVDAYGVKVVDENGKDVARVAANTYKLLPGHQYTKDPIIHVDAASEDCILFVKLDNGIADIEAGVGFPDYEGIVDQMAMAGWFAVDGQENVYCFDSVKSGNTDVEVFWGFTLKGDIDETTLNEYENAKIVVNAYAVQADGFDADKNNSVSMAEAQAAWTATFGATTEPDPAG